MRVLSVQLALNQGQSRAERRKALERQLLRIEAEKLRPDLLLLPELWDVGFFDYDSYSAWAQERGGETERFLSAWAKRLNCWFLAGSMIEREASGKKEILYNTALLFDRNGTCTARYRKLHLFGYESREQALLTAGTEVVTVLTEFGVIGIATCYDLRFPEQFRVMADRGVAGIAVVAAWPMQRLEHWRLFNQVRALENQCFLFSCNGAGIQQGVTCAGHSMVVGPDGRVLAEAGASEQLFWCDIDLEEADAYRAVFPALADRKRINENGVVYETELCQ